MKLNLAENLKRLRKEHNITQEELAGFIGVSFQAVSKWERDEGYPDITLLPSIANFFNVTLDELIGMNDIQNQKKRNDCLQTVSKLICQGKIGECISILRDSLHCFPNDFEIMLELASYLISYGNTPEERKNNLDESIKLFERILEFCTDNKIRYNAQSSLCISLWKRGETEKAIKIARDFPGYYDTAETALPRLLSGQEKIYYCQTVIEKLVWHFWWLISHMAKGNAYSDAEKIELFKKAIAFYEIIYEKEDYAFAHCRLSAAYEDVELLLLKQEKVDEGLEYLKKCVEHAVAFDTLPDSMKLSSLLVNSLEYKKINTSSTGEKNLCRCILDGILDEMDDERSPYHQCKDNDKFKQIINILEATAN